MPFPTAAISAGNLNLLRNTANAVPAYRGAQYVSVDANTVVLACQIAAVSNFDGIGEFGYYNITAGAVADVMPGMTIWFSRTNDIRAAYRAGRIRDIVNIGSGIHMNETSAPLAVDDYVFIVDDHQIWPKLGREIAQVFYVDYDITFRQLLPRITGLQRAYANWVTSGFYEIAFSSVQGYAMTSGATISSYLWDAADGTFVVGNSASQNPTIKFPPGERYIYLTVTDSGGRTLTRAVKIFAHDPSTYPPALGFSGATWGCSDPKAGWEASCEAFDGVEDLLDRTLVVFWSDETIGGTDGSIGNNVNWVGNIRQEANRGRTDEQSSYVADVAFSLEGTAQQLARLHKMLVPMTNVAAPTVWGEITNLTPWRAFWYAASEYSTLPNVCDVAIDDVTNTYLAQGMTTQGNSLIDVFNDIGVSINSHIEFAPTGEVQFVRDLRFRSTAARSAATVIASWTTTDFTNELSIEVEHVETTGRVDASGGTYNSTAAQVTASLALWPGVAQNYPDGQSSLTRQILTANLTMAAAETELNARAGRAGGIANPTDRIGTQHPDGYGQAFLVPSFGYYWKWILAAATNIRNRAYTTSNRFFLVSASMSHDNTAGTREVRATYIEDIDETTLAAPGVSVHYPPQGEIDLSIPDIPPFDAFPNIPEEPLWFDETTATVGDEIPDPNTIGGPVLRDGNTVFYGNATEVWLTQNFIKAAKPKSIDVTPIGITAIQMGLLDQRPGERGAWLLDYDSGADVSSVWYTEDVYNAAPDWFQGAELEGQYKLIRQTSGGIALYGPNITAASSTITDDLTTALGPQTGTVSASNPFSMWAVTVTNAGEYSATGGRTGGGSILGENTGYIDSGAAKAEACAFIDLGAEYTVTDASFWYKNALDNQPFAVVFDFFDDTKTFISATTFDSGSDSSTAYQQATFSGSVAGVRYIGFSCTNNTADGNPSIDDLSVTYTIGAGSGAKVAFSSNNGDSYSGIISVGTSPGATGGFDAARSGGVTIAAADEQAYKATTLGGAYSTLGAGGATTGSDPILLILPYYAWGSTTTKNYPDSTPDYLLGSAALVSSEALWKVTGAGSSTAITDSTGGNKVIPVGPNSATTVYGTKIAYIGTAGGTRYLSISTNTGTSWSRVAIGANAVFVRVRRGTTTGQLYLADGTVIKFSRNFTTTLTSKTTPAAANLTWVDILG
jgi:hypothetical protein